MNNIIISFFKRKKILHKTLRANKTIILLIDVCLINLIKLTSYVFLFAVLVLPCIYFGYIRNYQAMWCMLPFAYVGLFLWGFGYELAQRILDVEEE